MKKNKKNNVNNSVKRPQNRHLKSFKPGQSGNPNGRPKGSRNWMTELTDALEKAKKDHSKSFFEHFMGRAYKNDTVAIALAKKLIPDKISSELDEKTQAFIQEIINYARTKKIPDTRSRVQR